MQIGGSGAFIMPNTPFHHLGSHLLLGELLIGAGYLTTEQLTDARREQERIDALLGETLVGLGYVDEAATSRIPPRPMPPSASAHR